LTYEARRCFTGRNLRKREINKRVHHSYRHRKVYCHLQRVRPSTVQEKRHKPRLESFLRRLARRHTPKIQRYLAIQPLERRSRPEKNESIGAKKLFLSNHKPIETRNQQVLAERHTIHRRILLPFSCSLFTAHCTHQQRRFYDTSRRRQHSRLGFPVGSISTFAFKKRDVRNKEKTLLTFHQSKNMLQIRHSQTSKC
jgi:hypothetical protein